MKTSTPALWLNLLDPERPMLSDGKGKPKKRSGKFGYGCHNCPLDTEGRRKLLGHKRIQRRRAMLFSISPGKQDVINGLELTGVEGKMLWEEMDAVGLSRDDFDIQNIVRCRPVKKAKDGLVVLDREPTGEEIAHCRQHTDTAFGLNKGETEIIVALGKKTAMTLFGKEYKGGASVFWSERYSAMVYCLDSPSYFTRGNFADWKLELFQKRLAAVAAHLKYSGRFGWIKAQNLKAVYKPKSVRKVVRDARRAAKKGERVSVDIETGFFGRNREKKIICIGFSWAKDQARTIFLNHKDLPLMTPGERREVQAALKDLLEDKQIEKIFQYGSFDVDEILALLGIKVRGYLYDTIYASFLNQSFQKKHGLAAITQREYPEYAGYYDLIKPHIETSGNYADIPIPIMTLYNGADAAVTKRIELDIIAAQKVDYSLLRTYTRAGWTLDRMEDRGPVLDMDHFKLAAEVIPHKVVSLTNQIRIMADNPDLNPNTPDEIAEILYDKLGFETIDPDTKGRGEGKYRVGHNKKINPERSTKKEILELLAQKYKHEFPEKVIEFRRFSKMESTYLSNYLKSAEMNQGELRTKWFLTGAATGRLRSGGSRDGFDGKVNFQNLHGSPFLQNLLVSDRNWRLLTEDPRLSQRLLEALDREQKGLPYSLPDEILDLDAFISNDYGQIEIRMLAECSGDPLLCRQFIEANASDDPSDPRSDIHCLVGNLLNPAWSLEFIKADKPTRTFVKGCHFGMVFGLSPDGLYFYLTAQGVKTTKKRVAEFHERYFRKYKGVARFIKYQRAFAEKYGYVENIFGFRRMIGGEDDRDTNPANQAINTPIQGAAHTFLLCAMALMNVRPDLFPALERPIMEVHDSIVWRTKVRDLPEAYKQSKFMLEKAVPQYIRKVWGRSLRVPLLAEATVGFRYGVQVDYEGGPLPILLNDWKEKNVKVDAEMAEEFELAA